MNVIFYRIDLRLWRIAWAGCLIGILALSLVPNPASLMLEAGWDKTNHALAFFVLGILSLNAFPGSTWWTIAGLAGYGALIEVLQGMTAHRTAEWQDLIADMFGIVAAIGVIAIMRRYNAVLAR